MSEPQISGHEEIDPWAMNLVVDDSHAFTTVELMYAVASAVTSSLAGPMDDETRASMERWASGRFRKILRRAKNSSFTKVMAVPGKTYTFGNVRIHACTPFPVTDTPKDVSRTQVSGLKVLEGPSVHRMGQPERGDLIVASNTSLGMSPGKEAVAVAHAAQILLGSMDDTAKRAWAEAGRPIVVRRGLPEWITEDEAPAAIHDAGLTEVTPGSLTALGWYAA